MSLKRAAASAIADATGKIADAASDIVGDTSKQANATQRHENDMLADNKFSKLIRPLVTTWAVLFFTATAVLHYLGHPADAEIKSTINLVLGLSVGFYFPGRTIEKWIRQNTGSKK